jgi:hypothetical protein
MNKKITKPKGNIFVGLGFDPAEATVLLMRADPKVAHRLYTKKDRAHSI